MTINDFSVRQVYHYALRCCPEGLKPGLKKAWNAVMRTFTTDVENVLEKAVSKKRDGRGRYTSKLGSHVAVGESTDELVAFIVESASQVRESKSAVNIDETQFRDRISSLSVSRNGQHAWENLFRVCLLSGLFESSCVVRDKLIDRVYLDYDRNPDDRYCRHRAFSASIEQRHLASSKDILENIINDRYLKDEMKSRYRFIRLANNGKFEEAERIGSEYMSMSDSAFRRYVEGKSVAIVGPGTSSTNKGKEIDAHDIVVRLNHITKERALDPDGFGTKKNVIYYTGDIAKRVANGETSPPDSCEWIVSRKNDSIQRLSANTKASCRASIKNVALFKGAPNMIPLTLFDILHCSPSKISIFNINLYLDETIYDRSYVTKNENMRRMRLIRSFESHDCLSNFLFMKNMLLKNAFSPDGMLEDVLRLSSHEYMEGLKEIHVED